MLSNENFEFYLADLVGYFSKCVRTGDEVQVEHSLSVIMELPEFRKEGIAAALIKYSYDISKTCFKPEEPTSSEAFHCFERFRKASCLSSKTIPRNYK